MDSKSIDDLMETASQHKQYTSEPIDFELLPLNANSSRSVVKSAIALAFCAGVESWQCNLAIDYLLQDSEDPCFGYYYKDGVDFIVDRPTDIPFHCICVVGRDEEQMLVSYVELFGLWRLVICLSATYSGPDFTEVYAIDPTTGHDLDLDVKIDLTASDIHAVCSQSQVDDLLLSQIANHVIALAKEANFRVSMNKGIDDATAEALSSIEIEAGAEWKEKDANAFIDSLLENLLPSVLHHMESRADER